MSLAEMRPEIVAQLDKIAPQLAWNDFLPWFQWNQGEHIAMIGPTGAGKTTLALAVLPLRKYITVLATKPNDSTLKEFGHSNGFEKFPTWPEATPELSPRRIIWPDAKSLYSAASQQKQFKLALEKIYREGGWCVYVDELWFVIHHLRLELEIRTYLQQSRSNYISLVCATQRPSRVPLEIYDQSTHLFFWRDNDERNLQRISGISWLSGSYVRALVANLEPHEVLYIHVPTGRMFRTMAPSPERKGNARSRRRT